MSGKRAFNVRATRCSSCIFGAHSPIKPDPTWVNAQQIAHKGRFSACVFDVWD